MLRAKCRLCILQTLLSACTLLFALISHSHPFVDNTGIAIAIAASRVIQVTFTMSSVTLPPLPSARAKEIEKRQQTSITETSLDRDDTVVETKRELETEAIQETHPTPVPSKSTQHNIRDQQEKRSQQLLALQKKEEASLADKSPLDPNLLCEAIHQYICTTSSFLNDYVSDVNASLEGVGHKLNVLEDQMGILEGRLASIPGLLDDETSEETTE